MPEQETVDKAASRPESPTTAKQLDFDDDAQESTPPAAMKGGTPVTKVDATPTSQPRTGNSEAETTLAEAFPSIDIKVIRAVLSASGGQVEPAFNALLGMSDPSAHVEDDRPPPQPPRPAAAQRQLEQDELYARQLAQQYEQAAMRQQQRQHGHDEGRYEARQDSRRYQENEGLYNDDRRVGDQGRERSFFDDDLPEIQKNIRDGFIQTQSTVNGWLSNLRKKLDGEDDNDDPYKGPTTQDRPSRPPQPHSDYYGDGHAGRSRPSGDYDADPRQLGDDFGGLELRDDETPPPKPARPHAKPDLFKPTPPAPSGPVDEVEAADRMAATSSGGGAGSAPKKWQPLTSIAPHAEAEDNDPFSVGDSDDEKEKEKEKTTDVREADTARLKEAAKQKDTPALAEGEKAAEKKEK